MQNKRNRLYSRLRPLSLRARTLSALAIYTPPKRHALRHHALAGGMALWRRIATLSSSSYSHMIGYPTV